MELLIVYFIGLLIGVIFYSLTFYFSEELSDDKRKIVTGVSGLLCIIGGLVVGGFKGMPISLVGLGIFTVAILLWVGGKNLIFRKLILAIIVLFALVGLLYIGLDKHNKGSFTIDEKDERLDPTLKNYYNQLQTNTDIKGFKTFDTYEDDKAIILSLGSEKKGNNIEVLDVENKTGRTIINVRTFANQSSERNPSIIILLQKLEPDIVIKDTDGTIYKEAQI
ncbi:MAG: hypothetical protein ACQEWU_10425, partial [Bacillota bacterium]